MTNGKQQMIPFQMLAMLLVLPVACTGVLAQTDDGADNSGWNRLERLPHGKKVRVIQWGGARVRGKLIEVREDGIVLRRKKREIDIPREEIFQIFERQKFSRGKKIAKATGIGAVVGLALPLALFCESDVDICSGEAIVVGIILAPFTAVGGAIVGAIKGAASKPKYHFVYEARYDPQPYTRPTAEDWVVQP